MRLSFTYEVGDFLAVERLRRSVGRLRVTERDEQVSRLATPVVAVGALVALAVHIRHSSRPSWALAGWMVATAIVVAVGCLAWVADERRRRRVHAIAVRSPRMYMRVGHDGVSVTIGNREPTRIGWHEFDRVEEEASVFFLRRLGSRSHWLIVPARGLTGPATVADLRKTLSEHVRRPTGAFPVLLTESVPPA